MSKDVTYQVTRDGQRLELAITESGLQLGPDQYAWSDIQGIAYPAAFSAQLILIDGEPATIGFRSAFEQKKFRIAIAETGRVEGAEAQAEGPAWGQRMPLLTLPHAPGADIDETFGMVTAHTVIARNVLSDMGADLKSVIGGNLGSLEIALERAVDETQNKLNAKARAMGANMVLGVHMQVESVSDKAQAVVLSGTAVRASGNRDSPVNSGSGGE